MSYAEYDEIHEGWVIYKQIGYTLHRVTIAYKTECEAWCAYNEYMDKVNYSDNQAIH